jgi:glucosylceramidase
LHGHIESNTFMFVNDQFHRFLIAKRLLKNKNTNYKITAILIRMAFAGCSGNKNRDTAQEDETIEPSETFINPALGKESTIYTTASESELRLTENGKAAFEPTDQPLENEVSVFDNPNKSFQSFLGIGGDMTDASAEVFAQMPVEKQEEFLTACYDEVKGIGYSLCRTPVHSCDFSSGSYTYMAEGGNLKQIIEGR